MSYKNFQIKDLKELTKLNLSTMNTVVATSGYIYALDQSQQLGLFFSTDTALFVIATQLLAMSSQTFNQIIERNYDSKMERTKNRPLVI